MGGNLSLLLLPGQASRSSDLCPAQTSTFLLPPHASSCSSKAKAGQQKYRSMAIQAPQCAILEPVWRSTAEGWPTGEALRVSFPALDSSSSPLHTLFIGYFSMWWHTWSS